MDNFYQQDKLSELWNKIDHYHLKFLDIEESPEKIEMRNKLEGNLSFFWKINNDNNIVHSGININSNLL